MQFVEQRARASLALAASNVRWLATDPGLDRVERGDALQGRVGNGARDAALAVIHVPPRSTRVRPAKRLVDTPGVVDLPVAAVGVSLQHAVEVLQVLMRMLALAVGCVLVPGCR